MTLTRTSTLKPARTRKCAVKGCGNRFQPRSMMHKVCSEECAGLVAVTDRKKAEAKAEAKADKAKRFRLKTRSEWIADVQVAFNALVRFRDRNEQCISCQTHLPTLADQPGGGFDCGHYRSRGSAPHLRFDFRNAHGQCKKCNRYRAGNAADYRIGLIRRLGLETVEALECDQTGGGWTIPELIGMRDDFRAQLAKMKKETPP